MNIILREATMDDLALLQHWDTQPHNIAADPNDDWNWAEELPRQPAWREQLIAELDGRPIGFIQIIDPAEEESHYWGEVPPNLRAIDIWIGEAQDLGQGYGTVMMQLALARCFAYPEVQAALTDPLETNTKAHRFYERMGFRLIEKRTFGEDDCLVYRLDRANRKTQNEHATMDTNTSIQEHLNTVAEKTKRQMILEAAARRFRDQGYAATSMRDLAQAVQLKASSLYNHIGSKEEILRDICFENAERFHAGMQKAEQMKATAAEKVQTLIRMHIHLATEEVTSVTAFNDEWRHLSEPHLSRFKALRRDYEARFQAIIEVGIQQEEFKNLNALTVLYTIFSSVRWLYDWYKPERKVTAEELYEQIATVLMRGLENDLKK